MSNTHQCVLATWYTWKYKQTIHSWLDATQGCINVCFLLDVLYYITGNFFTTWQVLWVDKKWNKKSKVLYMLWLNKSLVSMLFSCVFRWGNEWWWDWYKIKFKPRIKLNPNKYKYTKYTYVLEWTLQQLTISMLYTHKFFFKKLLTSVYLVQVVLIKNQ